MKLIIDERLREVDDVFFGVFKYLNLIRHVTPVNVEEQKELFFLGKNRNPVFRYKLARTDIGKVRKMLKGLEISLTGFGNIYEQVRLDFLKRCDVIENIGVDDSVVKQLTSEIYGWPNRECLEYAKKILNEFLNVEVELDVPSCEICNSVKKMIDDLGLKDWEVKFSERWLTRTKYTKKIFVCERRKFSKLDVLRLPVHEVGVHAVRYENGYLQPLKIFGFGFPGFLSTEEGLATYFEEKTGNSSNQIFRNYAGRVVAIDCLRRELDFRDCYLQLKGYNFCDDDAWSLAVRVYRGGGFVKDHVYLEGYLQVKNFVNEGGDLKKLYVGKVGLDDLPLVEDLLDSGLINEPKFLPSFLS